MADIAMCHGGQCPSKNECYRHRAVANEYWQTYSNFQPDDSGKCEYFWAIEGRRVAPEKEQK
jgi:hypothetical protein